MMLGSCIFQRTNTQKGLERMQPILAAQAGSAQAGSAQQAAQGYVQLSFEHLHGWSLHNLSEPSVSVYDCIVSFFYT